jgi:hypothetical protein
MCSELTNEARGGGNTENLENDRFGPALRWMCYEAIQWGIRLEQDKGKWYESTPKSSMNWFWRLIECMPIKRLSYKGPDSTSRRCASQSLLLDLRLYTSLTCTIGLTSQHLVRSCRVNLFTSRWSSP